jgi:hypothetical protein
MFTTNPIILEFDTKITTLRHSVYPYVILMDLLLILMDLLLITQQIIRKTKAHSLARITSCRVIC